MSLRNYLKKVAIDQKPEKNLLNQEMEMKYFRRNLYLDINRAKIKEILTDQHRVYLKEKR